MEIAWIESYGIDQTTANIPAPLSGWAGMGGHAPEEQWSLETDIELRVVCFDDRRLYPGCVMTQDDEFSDKTTVVTRTQRSRFGSDGILRQTMIEGTDFSADEAPETLARHSKQVGGKRLRILVDTCGVPVTTQEARLAFASEEIAKLVTAVALLIKSPVNRVLGNLSLGLNRANVPVKLFTSEAKALEWLGGFPKQ